MTNAVDEAVQRGVPRQGPPTYGYYRQPNGWITVSPVGELDELKYRKEGWEPLSDYGRFEMTSEYMADHPLEPLFMFGGVKELSQEQIIQSGLHLDPPLVPTCRTPLGQFHKHHVGTCWAGAEKVSFPQLENAPDGLPCHFCDREFPTQKAQEQHEGVMHKDEKSDIRTGQTLADSLVSGLKGANVLTPSAPVGSEQPTTSDPYVCGFCGDGFKQPAPFLAHVKKHKESTDGSEATEES